MVGGALPMPQGLTPCVAGAPGGMLWAGDAGPRGSAPLQLTDGLDGTHARSGISSGCLGHGNTTFELQVGAEAASPGQGWDGAARKLLTCLVHKSSGSQSEARTALGTQDGSMPGTDGHFSS